MAEKAGFAAVIAMFMMAVGEALGNIAPDFSDVLYYNAVINGAISNGTIAFLVYDIYPALQYFIIAAIIGFTWYFSEDSKLTVKVGIFAFSFVYVTSTVLLFGLFAKVIPDYSIPIDIITCVACLVAVLAVEEKLTWENLGKPLHWIYNGFGWIAEKIKGLAKRSMLTTVIQFGEQARPYREK